MVFKSLLGSIFYISTLFLIHTNFLSSEFGSSSAPEQKKQTIVTCSCVNSASKMLTFKTSTLLKSGLFSLTFLYRDVSVCSFMLAAPSSYTEIWEAWLQLCLTASPWHRLLNALHHPSPAANRHTTSHHTCTYVQLNRSLWDLHLFRNGSKRNPHLCKPC